ncbi:MAG: NUDIX hydrolase [Planctomycetaceae bacterium]|nr:NUDIX hydrolase [Planctomycetaceae bacterium]
MKKKRSGKSEKEFLARYDASRYPHPSVSVDVALVTVDEDQLKAVLVRRAEHPAQGKWSLPGGFVGMNESLDEAASRVLETKVGVNGIFLEQLYTFGEPHRDPRTRVITVAYYALVDAGLLVGERFEDQNAQWVTLKIPWKGEHGGPVEALDEGGKPLPIAFDHAEILGLVVQRLRGKLNYAPIGFELLPTQFTLRQLQSLHETILGRTYNKDSFRRRLLSSGLIVPTGEREQDVGHRPAELYQFKRQSK